MDLNFQNGILTDDQVTGLSNLLRLRSTLEQAFMESLTMKNVKYFVAPKDHLYNIYKHRLRNTSIASIKTQLEHLVQNMDSFKGNSILVSFIGPENDRAIVFSNTDFQLLLGTIHKA